MHDVCDVQLGLFFTCDNAALSWTPGLSKGKHLCHDILELAYRFRAELTLYSPRLPITGLPLKNKAAEAPGSRAAPRVRSVVFNS